MKKLLSVVLLAALVMSFAALPASVRAQGDLTEQFDLPGTGFSIAYPAGWGTQELPGTGWMLISEPSIDAANAETLPPGVSAVALIDMADAVGMIDDPGLVLESFLGLEGNLPDEQSAEPIMIAGYEAAIVSYMDDEQGLYTIAAAFFTEDSSLMLIGFTSPEQEATFVTLFQAMLDSITVSAAPAGDASSAAASDIPPIRSVRVTLDQTLTSSWNEIDTIALIDDSNGEMRQWPISATATSEYGNDSWSAMQATGEPDTDACGDFTTAWASATRDGQDSLTVTYGAPMVPTRVDIYQTYNPGAIVLVELLPADEALDPIVIFEGVDSTTDCPGVFSIPVGDAEADNGDGSAAAADMGDLTPVTLAYATFGYPAGWTLEQDSNAAYLTSGDFFMAAFTSPAMLPIGDNLYDIVSGGLEAILEPGYEYSDQTVGDYRGVHVTGVDTSPDALFVEMLVVADDGNSEPFFVLAVGGPQDQEADVAAIYNMVFPSVSFGEPGAADSSAPTSQTAITYGDTASGSITTGQDTEEWVFEGTAGDVITITMIATETSLDPLLQLIGPEASFAITYNDDADDISLGLNAQIAEYELPSTGTYIIEATSYGGSTGAYELTLEVAGGASSAPAPAAQPIAYGDTASGNIDDITYAENWTFTGTAGDVVTITMIDVSPDDGLDPLLILQDQSGAELAYNDDAFGVDIGSLNSQITEYELPFTGSYTIVATRFLQADGSSNGAYELTLEVGAGDDK